MSITELNMRTVYLPGDKRFEDFLEAVTPPRFDPEVRAGIRASQWNGIGRKETWSPGDIETVVTGPDAPEPLRHRAFAEVDARGGQLSYEAGQEISPETVMSALAKFGVQGQIAEVGVVATQPHYRIWRRGWTRSFIVTTIWKNTEE